MSTPGPEPTPALRRLERVAEVIGRHTLDICVLAIRAQQGRLEPDDFAQRVHTRSARTIMALLACVHEDGPP